MQPFLRGCLLLSALVPATTFAAAPHEMNVNVRLTEAGKNFVPPTQARPIFYLPVVAGYSAQGRPEPGDAPPATPAMVEACKAALAREGYRVASATTPRPTLMLVFQWGVLRREVDEVPLSAREARELGTETREVTHNLRDVWKLVSGQDFETNPSPIEYAFLKAELETDRCFVLVAAYDYAAAEAGRKTPLWITRMSVPSGPLSLDVVLPKLIAAGASLVGRETRHPQHVAVTIEPKGKVNVGTPVVVPEASEKK